MKRAFSSSAGGADAIERARPAFRRTGGPAAFAAKVMWGLPVVATKTQALGTFTVGGFDLASQVWDCMDATVEVSNQDRDNFVKNMLTILCEERLALSHYRPTAIIKGTFTPAAGG